MSTAAEPIAGFVPYRLREFHPFESAGVKFLYLVPSGAIFSLDPVGREIVDELAAGPQTRQELFEFLLRRGHNPHEAALALEELEQADVIGLGEHAPVQPKMPDRSFPLQRIVLNVTNQCNLACGYCYEYSDDKISNTTGKPKYMNHEVAEAAIDMLIHESASRPAIHVTFFGGETLMNFPLLRSSVDYAKRRCAETNKTVEFSLTTNATLLNEKIVDFLSEHRIGVTVSIDGDRELNDKMRVFHDGRGSYDVIVPKIKMLLQRHRTNSIGARVTLSAGVSHVRRIYDHLTQEVGFDAVGFSPLRQIQTACTIWVPRRWAMFSKGSKNWLGNTVTLRSRAANMASPTPATPLRNCTPGSAKPIHAAPDSACWASEPPAT